MHLGWIDKKYKTNRILFPSERLFHFAFFLRTLFPSLLSMGTLSRRWITFVKKARYFIIAAWLLGKSFHTHLHGFHFFSFQEMPFSSTHSQVRSDACTLSSSWFQQHQWTLLHQRDPRFAHVPHPQRTFYQTDLSHPNKTHFREQRLRHFSFITSRSISAVETVRF